MKNRELWLTGAALTGVIAAGATYAGQHGNESIKQTPAATAEASPSATPSAEPTAKAASSANYMGSHHHHHMTPESTAMPDMPEVEATKAPAKIIVVNTLGKNACKILVRAAEDLHPERQDVWIDDLQQIEKDANELDAELEKESDSGKYSEEALHAGMTADESLKITRENGADNDKEKAMQDVAAAVESYCEGEMILN